jgi:hypothetical protein
VGLRPVWAHCEALSQKPTIKCSLEGAVKTSISDSLIGSKGQSSLIHILCGLNKLIVILEIQPVFLPTRRGECIILLQHYLIPCPIWQTLIPDYRVYLLGLYLFFFFLAYILMSILIWWVRVLVFAAKNYLCASIILFHLRNHFCFHGINWIDEC